MRINYLDILHDVEKEMERQDSLKLAGKFKYTLDDKEMTNLVRAACITEECGEISKAVLAFEGLAPDDEANIKEELIQVAALCIKWLESGDY